MAIVVRSRAHALEQMQVRNITTAEVEYVVQNFHTHYRDRKGNPILIGHVNGRRIKVVVRWQEWPNEAHVITTGD